MHSYLDEFCLGDKYGKDQIAQERLRFDRTL